MIQVSPVVLCKCRRSISALGKWSSERDPPLVYDVYYCHHFSSLRQVFLKYGNESFRFHLEERLILLLVCMFAERMFFKQSFLWFLTYIQEMYDHKFPTWCIIFNKHAGVHDLDKETAPCQLPEVPFVFLSGITACRMATVLTSTTRHIALSVFELYVSAVPSYNYYSFMSDFSESTSRLWDWSML